MPFVMRPRCCSSSSRTRRHHAAATRKEDIMKKLVSQRSATTRLDNDNLKAVAGGDLDGDWCGTRVPGFHPPRPIIFNPIEIITPVIRLG
jgi:hypothetical protein